MSKTIFMNFCRERGVSKENAKNAWEKLQFLVNHIKENWDDITRLEYMPQDKRLELRRYAAEQGTEYTPAELDDLINFISLVKKDIKSWDN